jgi:hypothetical protein
METTVKLQAETRDRLNVTKYSLSCKTIDETVNKILDIINKMEVFE